MKIKKSNLLLLCIILCIIALDDFFSIGIPVNNTYLFMGAFIVSFILCVLYWQREMATISHKFIFVYEYEFAMALSFLIVFLYSLSKYPAQDFNATLNCSYPYLALLLVYPILVYVLRRDDTKQVYQLLDVFSIVIYGLILVQVFLYNTHGSLVMLESAVRLRDGHLRIGMHFYGNLMILYNFYKIYCKKERNLFRWILFGCGFFELIYFQQTRAYTLVTLVGIFAIVLLEKNTRNVFFKKIIIVLLAIAIISQTEVVSNLIQSLSATGVEAGSTIGRQYAMAYYWSMFTSNFPFGMGFPNGDKYYSVLHHQVDYYTTYVDDVGIWGQICVWGLFIIPIFIVPLFRWLHILRDFRKNEKRDEYVWYSALLAYIIVSSATLIVLDSYRIMMLPIFLALVEFEYSKIFAI
jgi:hypothetical protein